MADTNHPFCCAGCQYFDLYRPTIKPYRGYDGICRRYPPVVLKDTEEPRPHWPPVYQTSWCGEWIARGTQMGIKDIPEQT